MKTQEVRFYDPYDEVHTDMHPFLRSWLEVNDPPFHTLTPEEVRDTLDNHGSHEKPPRPNGLVVNDIVAPLEGRDLRMRVYRPASLDGPQPVMVYFHAGGWTIGNIDSHDRYVAFLAFESGVPFVSVDYRLAPEHKNPAQLYDAFDSIAWIRQNAPSLGFDPKRVGIGGDSAGAQMSAATTLLARDRGELDLVFQLLIYPPLDSDFDRPSWWRYSNGPILTRDWQIWCWRNWQVDPTPRHDPYSYPLQAEDLSGLPPAHIALAEIDVLLDEGVLYAHRLLDAGVPTSLQISERLPHGYLRGMYTSEYVRREMRQIAQAVKRGFACL